MRTSLAIRHALSETEGSDRPERRFPLLHEPARRGGSPVHHKKEALRPGRSASSCSGGGETYGFACVWGCVLLSCFFWWIFFDAWFCSWLTCFFSAVVSLPPLALRSAATCLLMPFCCFSSFAVSPGVNFPLLIPCAMRSCWFSRR